MTFSKLNDMNPESMGKNQHGFERASDGWHWATIREHSINDKGTFVLVMEIRGDHDDDQGLEVKFYMASPENSKAKMQALKRIATFSMQLGCYVEIDDENFDVDFNKCVGKDVIVELITNNDFQTIKAHHAFLLDPSSAPKAKPMSKEAKQYKDKYKIASKPVPTNPFE